MRLPHPILTRFALLAWSAVAVSGSEESLFKAVAGAPAIAAAGARVAAATARIDSSGRLPDLEFEGMVSRADMEVDSTMLEMIVRQPLPRRGERAADRDRARATLAMAEADYAELAGEIAADVAMALAESEGAGSRMRALETQLSRMGAVLHSLDTLIATGFPGRIGDRLILQSRIASMQLMIEEERRMASDALSAARGRLGLAAEARLPSFAAPGIHEIRPAESPALRTSEARTAGADAMARMARAGANPMTAFGVRLEREESRMGTGDTIGVAFMSEIPWRSRRYAVAETRAAEAERAAARAEGESSRHRIATALDRAVRAERLADTARHLAEETRSRLETEFDAFLLTAGTEVSGESSVLKAVDILDRITGTALQVIQAETAARSARAELWRHVPSERLLRPLLRPNPAPPVAGNDMR